MLCELDLKVLSQKSKKKKNVSNILACRSVLVQSNAWQLVRLMLGKCSLKKLSWSFVEWTDGVCFHTNILDKVTAQLISLRYSASENIKARQNASSLDCHMWSWALFNHASLAVSPLEQFTDAVLRWTARPLGCVSHICFQAELRTDTSERALPAACISSAGHMYQPACGCLACTRKKKDGDPEKGEKAVVTPLGELVTVWCVKCIQ